MVIEAPSIANDPEARKYEAIYTRNALGPKYGHSNHGARAMSLFDGARSVLDIGCGYNEFAKKLRAQGIKAVGVDFACPGADQIATVFDLPFRDGEFEWVTAFDVLEHLRFDHINLALQEMSRVARRFCFSIGTAPAVRGGMQLHMTVQPWRWWRERIGVFAHSVEEWGKANINPHPYLIGQFHAPESETAFLVEPPKGTPKRIAVLCPGPSLVDFEPADGWDVVIGVNRAVCAHHCHYWVCLDFYTFGYAIQDGAKGRPVIVCTKDAWAQMGRGGKFSMDGWERMDRDEIKSIGLSEQMVRKNSSTTAVALATHLGGTDIHIYGMDWTGMADWDGQIKPKFNRSPSRWAAERKKLHVMVQAAGERGIRITRFVAEEVPSGS